MRLNGFLNSIHQDVRISLRRLARRPTSVLVAAFILALGIGGATAIFSIVDAALLRPLPFFRGNASALISVSAIPGRDTSTKMRLSLNEYDSLAAELRSFASTAIYKPWGYTISGASPTERGNEFVPGARVSDGFFAVFGIAPRIGRVFGRLDFQGGGQSVVISDSLWKGRFSGDAQILGRAVTVDGVPRVVIGVMPASFQFPGFPAQPADVWLPLIPAAGERGNGDAAMIARLNPTASVDSTRAELSVVAASLQKEFSGWRDKGLWAEPLRDEMLGSSRPMLVLLLTIAVALMLMACVNAASLSLARNAARQQEMAVRQALGAPRRRILQTYLVETTVLHVGAGIGGLVFPLAMLKIAHAYAPDVLARLYVTALDVRVFIFMMSIAVGTGVVCGMIPFFQATGRAAGSDRDGVPQLQAGGRATRGFKRDLLVVQTALATLLLASSGLLVRTLGQLRAVDLGFDPSNVLTMWTIFPAGQAQDSALQRSFFDGLLQKLEGDPAVVAAAITDNGIFNGTNRRPVVVPDSALNVRDAETRVVSDSYFRALGISVIRGRVFEPHDGPASPRVAVVDDTFARRLWPGLDPVGRKLAVEQGDHGLVWREVVGVVAGVRDLAFGNAAEPTVYLPFEQQPFLAASLLVKLKSDPLSFVGAVQAAGWSLKRDQVIFGAAPLESIVLQSISMPTFRTIIGTFFGLVAFLLAAVGVYGLISSEVTRSRREIGIRLALGATPGKLVRAVSVSAVLPSAAGIVFGLFAAVAVSKLAAESIFGVRADDPLPLIAAGALLFATSVVAAVIPALRAAKLAPSASLRHD